ncbi:MAG: arginine deiminase family protein, partial [Actinomycetota bacterium]
LRAVLVHRPGPEIDQIVVHAHGEARRAVKIRTIDLHPDDHPFTINGLAVRPGRVLMSEASRHTLDRLAKEGIEVIPLAFDAVYRGGGIHCSTAPLARDPV